MVADIKASHGSSVKQIADGVEWDTDGQLKNWCCVTHCSQGADRWLSQEPVRHGPARPARQLRDAQSSQHPVSADAFCVLWLQECYFATSSKCVWCRDLSNNPKLSLPNSFSDVQVGDKL